MCEASTVVNCRTALATSLGMGWAARDSQFGSSSTAEDVTEGLNLVRVNVCDVGVCGRGKSCSEWERGARDARSYRHTDA